MLRHIVKADFCAGFAGLNERINIHQRQIFAMRPAYRACSVRRRIFWSVLVLEYGFKGPAKA
ncbi:MAG: hypothetical protein DU429_04385 [Candidatus Tokpelaia sp.]|nr:MAG: hypothetical protein DU429_04385 [Candidatus Tokpelaia sp.]